MAKIGTETVSILGEWFKIEVRYSSQKGFYGKVPDRFPDFLSVAAGKEGMEIREADHKTNCEENVRNSIRVYAQSYNKNLPTKRHVLIIRHNDTRETHWSENHRNANWHGFKIEWIEAWMAGNSIFDKDRHSLGPYIKLEREAIIDYTPERAAFLEQICQTVDSMSDAVRAFIKQPPIQIEQLLDRKHSLLALPPSVRKRHRP